ncbi:MAG TPA: metallophosphoesterase family protein [Candidatus Acidoferrales bacterium]|jgi:putative phosphoesterase|nr:metallophosphoesterase family protein [Candidatus Acidoferrales bacterium]
MRIGIISDTHGLLRPEARQALSGVQLIIHAGDVGAPEILTQLKLIAPVFAVRGNVDTQPWAQELPLSTVVETSGFNFYVLHNLRDLDLKPHAAGFDAVISGHTHQAAERHEAGLLYLNPGSAGPRRFQLPVTLALLDLAKKPWRVEIVPLLAP